MIFVQFCPIKGNMFDSIKLKVNKYVYVSILGR